MSAILMLKRILSICILCLAANILVDKVNKDLELSKNARRILLVVLYVCVVGLVTWIF